MKTVADILRFPPVWVNPQHRIESAIWLMRGHDVGCLPVLEGSELVGLLLDRHMLGVDPNRTVAEVMECNFFVVSGTMSLRQAAELMTRERIGRLPVVDEQNRLIGVISDGDLLAELSRPVNPITGLPLSDTLQEWAIEQLRGGKEITVLFVDVDDFGQFNKRYGHVVGDTVLRSVANGLRALIDPQIDLLCHYGGDEFCVATLRTAEQTAALGERIQCEVAQLRVPAAREHDVTVTVGQRGGRRTREREHIHYLATLNNLINLASQDCMARKADKPRPILTATTEKVGSPMPLEPGCRATGVEAVAFGPPAAPEAPPVLPESTEWGLAPPGEALPLRLRALEVSWTGTTAHVHVELEQGSDAGARRQPIFAHSYDRSRAADREEALSLVAEATLIAVRRALPSDFDVRLEETRRTASPDGETRVTVVGQLVTGEGTHPITGSAPVEGDAYRAAAAAVLDAVNRPLETLLPSLAATAAPH